MAPMASVHGPATGAAPTDSTSTRAASVAESNRAPAAEEVPVRRATTPSSPSRRNAAAPRMGRSRSVRRPVNSCGTASTAHRATRMARSRVTRSAGVEKRGIRRSTEPTAAPVTTAPAHRPASWRSSPDGDRDVSTRAENTYPETAPKASGTARSAPLIAHLPSHANNGRGGGHRRKRRDRTPAPASDVFLWRPRTRPASARRAPAPSATALRDLEKNQTGSYMAGIGPMAGMSTYRYSTTAANALRATTRATA